MSLQAGSVLQARSSRSAWPRAPMPSQSAHGRPFAPAPDYPERHCILSCRWRLAGRARASTRNRVGDNSTPLDQVVVSPPRSARIDQHVNARRGGRLPIGLGAGPASASARCQATWKTAPLVTRKLTPIKQEEEESERMRERDDTPRSEGSRRQGMLKSEEVEAMLGLYELGWGTRRIAREFGCSRNTVKRYVEAQGWMPYGGPSRDAKLAGLDDWLRERFFRHRGNAEVVRQDLQRELSIDASLRTVERAVAPYRRLLVAEAKATLRFETPPGRQMQIGCRSAGRRYACICSWRRSATHGGSTCRRSSTSARRRGSRASRGRSGTSAGVPEEVPVDNAKPLVVRHDAATREVEFNDRFLALAAHSKRRSPSARRARTSRRCGATSTWGTPTSSTTRDVRATRQRPIAARTASSSQHATLILRRRVGPSHSMRVSSRGTARGFRSIQPRNFRPLS